MHEGEHIDEAVERELFEESGVKARFAELRGVVTEVLQPESGPQMHYLLLVCRLEAKTLRLRPSAEGDVRWFDAEELSRAWDQVVPSDRLILERLVLRRPEKLYYRCRVVERAGRYDVKMFR